jgi:glycerol uptake facilitator-like aquaporin
VTFAFALTRHFPRSRALGYWGAQITGALIAAALLRGSLGNIADQFVRDEQARSAEIGDPDAAEEAA